MKSALEMAEEAVIKAKSITFTPALTGGVYLLKRPENSTEVDVVINALALTGNQVQNGMVNINVHAPNLKNVKIKGRVDSTMPDLDTLKNVSLKIVDRFKDLIGFDYRMWIETPGLPYQDSDGTWYINNRVYYQFFQKQFKNI